MTITKVKSRYCVKCEALYTYQCKCPNNRRMFNIRKTFHKIADERVNESCDYVGIEPIEGKPKEIIRMKTFKEMTANQKAYREFFDKKLAKWKVKSPAELSDEDKKKFYNEIEKEWDKDTD